MSNLAFVQTADLVDELMSRYDVAVFCAGKHIGPNWTSFNEWKSVEMPHAAIGILEQFKFELMRNISNQAKKIETNDDPTDRKE